MCGQWASATCVINLVWSCGDESAKDHVILPRIFYENFEERLAAATPFQTRAPSHRALPSLGVLWETRQNLRGRQHHLLSLCSCLVLLNLLLCPKLFLVDTRELCSPKVEHYLPSVFCTYRPFPPPIYIRLCAPGWLLCTAVCWQPGPLC